MSNDTSFEETCKSKLNQHQLTILKRYPQFTARDLLYITDDVVGKVAELSLPDERCVISTYFVDAIFREYHQKKYCLHNCGFKCLSGEVEL